MASLHSLRLAAAALLLAAPAAGAQQADGQFDVATQFGYSRFGRATAIGNSPFVGVDATYHFKGFRLPAGLDLGTGFLFDASVPTTRADQFPPVAQDFGDTTFVYTVGQRITLLQTGLKGELGGHVGRARIFGFGGAGVYTMFLDARQNQGARTYNHQESFAGAGVNVGVTNSLGFRFTAQNTWFLAYDRQRLNPVVPYATERRLRDLLPPPDPFPANGRISNLQMSIAFTYVPTLHSAGGPETTP